MTATTNKNVFRNDYRDIFSDKPNIYRHLGWIKSQRQYQCGYSFARSLSHSLPVLLKFFLVFQSVFLLLSFFLLAAQRRYLFSAHRAERVKGRPKIVCTEFKIILFTNNIGLKGQSIWQWLEILAHVLFTSGVLFLSYCNLNGTFSSCAQSTLPNMYKNILWKPINVTITALIKHFL